MTSALEVFMKGMISSKSQECGGHIRCVLIVDNAAPDSECYNRDRDDDESVVSTTESCQTVETADLTATTSAAIIDVENLDLSEDHVRMLRWSASMGDRRALAELKAVEDKIAERDSLEYQKKLRWCAAMGDAASIAKRNAAESNSRWTAGNEKTGRKDVSPKGMMGLMKPMRRGSYKLPKLF